MEPKPLTKEDIHDDYAFKNGVITLVSVRSAVEGLKKDIGAYICGSDNFEWRQR